MPYACPPLPKKGGEKSKRGMGGEGN